MAYPQNHLRELALRSIDAALFLVEAEEQRLIQIIESEELSAEERLQALRDFASLSKELVAVLAGCGCLVPQEAEGST